ncbi:unnamed protein product, partial [Ectocarpus sp. 4 AP-2014]
MKQIFAKRQSRATVLGHGFGRTMPLPRLCIHVAERDPVFPTKSVCLIESASPPVLCARTALSLHLHLSLFGGLDIVAPLLAVFPFQFLPRCDDADDVVLHPPVPEL